MKRPRVLIVEEDPLLAMSSLWECIELGLEPKLCLGPDRSTRCPGLVGNECPRTKNIEATLISIESGRQRIAAPACAAGRLVISGGRPLVGSTTVQVMHPDARLKYPYSPRAAASLLFWLVHDERRRRAWDALRARIARD